MELNPYCIKNILIVLEKSMEPDQFGVVRQIVPEELLGKPPLDCYPNNVLMYHIQQMFNSNLLVRGKTYINSGIPLISDISPVGHQYLKILKDETNFKKFVTALSKTPDILSALVSLIPK